MSEWQMPQYWMSMTTSDSRGSRRSNENGTTGVVGESAAKPWAWIMAGAFDCAGGENGEGKSRPAVCLEKPDIPSYAVKVRFIIRAMLKDRLDGLLALKIVADRRSFTAAAAALRISPSAISQI